MRIKSLRRTRSIFYVRIPSEYCQYGSRKEVEMVLQKRVTAMQRRPLKLPPRSDSTRGPRFSSHMKVVPVPIWRRLYIRISELLSGDSEIRSSTRRAIRLAYIRQEKSVSG